MRPLLAIASLVMFFPASVAASTQDAANASRTAASADPAAPSAEVCLTNACSKFTLPLPPDQQAIRAAVDRGDLRQVITLNGSARDAMEAVMVKDSENPALYLLETARFAVSDGTPVIAVRVSEGHWNYMVRNELQDLHRSILDSAPSVCMLPGGELQPPCRR